MRWKRTSVPAFLIEEVKAEYVKVMKKLQVEGIVKPIPNPNQFSQMDVPQEEPLTIAQVVFN